MKFSALMLPACAALVLAACVDGPRHRPMHGSEIPPPARQQPMGHGERMPGNQMSGNHMAADRFACENGLSIYVRNLGNDRVELMLDDKRAVLTRATSGSGVRYVATNGLFGRGGEWHVKGNEGAFAFVDPYGNHVESVCRLAR